MFLLWLLPVALLAAWAAPGLAGDVESVIAFDNYPPYHYWEGVTPRGLNIELLDEAFARMGRKHRYERRTWKRSLYGVEHGEITALCAGFKTPEREEFSIYPAQYLSLETNWVISLKGSGVKVRDLKDLYRLSVGVVSDYGYDRRFDAMEGLNKEESKSDELLLRKLLNGRVDVMLGNGLVIRHLAERMKAADRLDFQLKLASEPLYLIFSRVRPESAPLAGELDRALESMHADGVYHKLLDKYQPAS
ncbi:substrate-binding periplasmic protein [Salidesulfovibrio onnuriiensis]|uniref:substrate-binding periplasmic protein n=1 Tax=Salidesulfovibrio onnuriiensis TaxID=2583823 RepID=UPI0016500EC9|nr:transporter substrate-binding domain-containing protein [Salidesulfovibrio onnuriiensis]